MPGSARGHAPAVASSKPFVGFLSCLSLVLAWDVSLVPELSPSRRRQATWPAVFVALTLPWWVPVDWAYPRILAAVWAITTAMKSHALGRHGPRDDAMANSTWRRLLWVLIPPETRWPRDADDRRRARRGGLVRLGRTLAKLGPIAGLLWLQARWPGLHDCVFVEATWALWLTWLAVTAITDAVSGVTMLAGLHVAENFATPVLATSSRDFWARRWNLFVHHFAARYVFLAAGGRRRPIFATFVVFVGSGLMHEYFVASVIGTVGAHPGWMLGFFVVHGVAACGQMALDRARRRGKIRTARLPRPVAVALHIAWLTATAPLFFVPLGEMFPGPPW